MKLQILNPKWRHSNVTLPLYSPADIFHVITFQGEGWLNVWLALYSLTPASSYRVILLSTGWTFMSFLYIASSPCVFQPQTKRSSAPFITVIFQTKLPLALMAAKCACKQELWEYKSLRGFQNFEDVLNVNPWVTSQACQFILQHSSCVTEITNIVIYRLPLILFSYNDK